LTIVLSLISIVKPTTLTCTHFSCPIFLTIYSFAFGSLTKYSRKFQQPAPFECYNPVDQAKRLARSVVLSFRDFADEDIPQVNLDHPRVVGCHLMSGLYYFSCYVPPAPTYHSREFLAQYAKGTELTTFKGESYEYIKFHLDENGYLQSITYIGDPLVDEAFNLMKLMGSHESHLNSLKSRFQQNLCPDLLSYVNLYNSKIPRFFRLNWATSLYHDEFSKFKESLKAEFQKTDFVISFRKELEANLVDGKISESDKDRITNRLRIEQMDQWIQTRLIEFLGNNKNELPLYFIPKFKNQK
jgi:hypothetical protein